MSGLAGCIGAAPVAVGSMLAAMSQRGGGTTTVTFHHGVTMGWIGVPTTAEHAVQTVADCHGILDGEFYSRQQQDADDGWLHDIAAAGPAAVADRAGIFALAAAGPHGLWLARDPLGVKPLYFGFDPGGRLWFASQIRPLLQQVRQPQEFPAGQCYDSRHGFETYYELPPPTGQLEDLAAAQAGLHRRLQRAVALRLDGPGRLGVFLSGGLDSSLCTAMALAAGGGEPLPSFAVGMAGSDDLAQAQAAARTLGTHHYERQVSRDELLDVLPAIIYDLESFDAAVVRGAVANHFAAALAKEHVDVVLSGEGADELFAGYHYLKHPRFEGRLEAELQRILRAGSRTTLQRLDRMGSRHQLVARVPFLDIDVVNFAWQVPTAWKLNRTKDIEKWILRLVSEQYLPWGLAWRTKAKLAMGTGIGPTLAAHAAAVIPTAEFERQRQPLPGLTLIDREELMYYQIFKDLFGNRVQDILPTMGRSPSLNNDPVFMNSEAGN